jgi:hypothetical protein
VEAIFNRPAGRQARALWANSALIATLTLLVGALALCFDRVHNGDLYLELASGRFISHHGLVSHDPFPTIAQGGLWLNQQWLAEIAFFRTAGSVGLTGLTVLYSILIALPLALLLWMCRRKGRMMLIAVAAMYFPGALAVIHPRAAGFSLLIFSVLVVLVAAVWGERSGVQRRGREGIAAVAILVLFALWANLHGGFIAGLVLIALVSVGAAIDHRRGLPGAISVSRAAVLGSIVLMAIATVTLATPLGGAIWDYILSFRNRAVSIASQEWLSAFHSPLAVAYIAAAAAVAAWTWVRSPPPRRATTLLVAVGFLGLAGLAIRNIVFVGPALAFVVAWSAPNRSSGHGRLPVALAACAAVLAAVVWVAILGPARDDPRLGSPAVSYALAHPPKNGRIVTYAGMGSYILWCSPRTPVALNGWLEHFKPGDLRGTYGLIWGWSGNLAARAKRLQAGAVITNVPVAIRRLKAGGYVAEFQSPVDTYLVRR